MASPPTRKKREMALSTQCKLIGEFVVHWNLLESSLNDAIISLCKLDVLPGVVITANLHFQTKMHIVTTMIDLLGSHKPKKWKDSVKDTIASMHTINNEWRTLIVHNLIRPVDRRSVKFLKVSAKRKLHWPDTTKTKKQFSDVCGTLLDLCNAMDKISRELSSAPIPPLVPPGWLNLPLLQPQATQYLATPPAILGTAGETPISLAPTGLGLGLLAGLYPPPSEKSEKK